MELICPAGTPAAFREAVDAGADAVYCGFRDETNARNFPGLNFSREELGEAIAYAHRRGAQTFVALNTFMRAGHEGLWYQAAADAVRLGADALILADFGLMAHVAETYPEQRLHVSVQASASNPDAVNFLVGAFGAKRVVLPRTLTISDIARLARQIRCEIEVFVFGGLCVMAEGRCSLSSYATGKSPNMNGVCSPASHVRYEDRGDELVSKLGEFTINSFAPGEAAGYPTLCKGRFVANGSTSYLFEEPSSLSTTGLLPRLAEAGVTALKIEGRQRGRAYVAAVVRAFRAATDALARGEPMPSVDLAALTEGGRATAGAYEKTWR